MTPHGALSAAQGFARRHHTRQFMGYALRRIALVSLLCLAVAGIAKGEDGMTPLHKAALAGDVATIKALLAGGADINTKTETASSVYRATKQALEPMFFGVWERHSSITVND